MPDLLNTSLTGMIAFQRALNVTSNNIANANTPGYSRQVAEFTTRLGSGAGNAYVGGGTQVSNIRRIYDQMLGEQLRVSTTSHSRFDTLSTLAGRIDTLLADPDTGLNTSLQSFFNAVQDLSNDPASIPTRQALLGEANGLAGRFQSLDQRLSALDGEVNQRLNLAVDEINRLSSSIASINDRIAATSAGGLTPPDLLDERDRLVMALSGEVAVSTTIQGDGTMSVFVGSGQSLVIGNQAQGLSVKGSEFDPTRLNIVYDGASGATPLDTSLTGGTLGGLLEFRGSMLDPARQSLGQTAVAFAQSFNLQHNAGMDLRGNLGSDFFVLDPPGVLGSGSNTGSGTAVAGIADLGAYTGADYVLEFDGAAYSLTRTDTGANIALSGSGTAGDPFIADGLEIEVGGAPAAGDRMLIRGGLSAASTIRTQIGEPLDIAMAGPTRSSASFSNTGDATISAAAVDDHTDPALLSSSVIQFIDANTYSVNGAGSFAYTDGDPIIINGTSVSISGSPLAGDQFTIEPNYGASGDNSNGLGLTDIQSRGLLDGGAISINENYGRLVAGVGGTTHQIQSNLDATTVVRRNAEDAMLSNSAVNIDEEAAKMIQYQQSYQAIAQVVGVAKTLFDSLLNATNR
ncbi:MAG: flagellar hook-associated protein FlgK [Woeseiaceae bacterium]|nr:flagellar hook-associated protein FlgK [Woeseiaceae bacterium]